MQVRVWVLVGGIGVMGLAGCGGGADYAEAYAARSDANNAMLDRLDARFNTAFDGMPTAGSATYTGYAVIKHSDGVSDDAQFLGDASVTADFANGTVEGQASNFGGWHNNSAVGSYSGSVVLSGGVIGINRPNDLGAYFSGTLVRGADTIVIDGGMIGDFKGTPIIGAITEIDADSTMTINGGAPQPIYGGFNLER